MSKPPRIKSGYVYVDVTVGRKALAKYIKANGPFPVVIHATLSTPSSHDDGVSIEFEAAVTKLLVQP